MIKKFLDSLMPTSPEEVGEKMALGMPIGVGIGIAIAGLGLLLNWIAGQ